MLKPGLVWIICQAGTAEGRAPLLVRPGQRPVQTRDQWIADQRSLTDGGVVTGGTSGGGMAALFSLFDRLAPTVHAQQNSGPLDYLWNNPANLVGSPRNTAIEPTKIGPVLPESESFQLACQVLSLKGRGINLNLGLYGNSKSWFRNGSTIYYAPLGGFPTSGFNLGFGYIVTYQSSYPPYGTAYLFIDRDGTPRYLAPVSTGSYQTNDGTHITYVGNSFQGTLFYKDGTGVTFSTVNNMLLPTIVRDRNGNYLTVAYKDMTQGYNPLAIDFITDTLGRIIQFLYNDANLDLTSITSPAMGGGSQTWVTFGYGAQTLRYNFSGVFASAPVSGTWNFTKLTSISLPNRSITLSYSDYGMPYSVSFSGGTQNASATFNYPTSGSTQLTDAPAFTQRVESPNSGTYSYSSSTDNVAQTKTFTITRPDSATVALTRSTNTSSVANGLMTQAELKDSTGHSMAKSVFSYANDPGGSPQVQSVITHDDGTPTPNQIQVNFDYDSLGDLANKREFGFQQNGSWVVRRRTHVNYVSAGGAMVPTEVDTYDAQLNTNDADDVLIAKTTYDVDNYNYPFPLNGIEDYGGTANPPGHCSAFNASYTNRGNLTAVAQWTDIAGNVSINRETRYDIFGNIAKAQVSCCSQKSLTFDQTTYWGDPTQVTSGDPNGVHLTNTATYDFNTTRVVSYSDPNNLSTSLTYDAALRPITATLPTGATADASFNDGSLSASSWLSYTDNGVNKTPTTGQVMDGWGHVTQTTDPAGNQANYAYNNMGLLQSRTNPFPQNGTPGPATTYQYDALGRATTVTLADGATLRTTYNGNTVTTTDQVGRQSQRQVDGLARVGTIVEQDPGTGSLSLTANCSYDYLNNLIQINQGGQIRARKYDALSRMLFERMPEQSAAINDGAGTMWSCKYTYTDFGAVATKTDARGVAASYSYDSMNRLITVSYDTSHAPGVASTANVNYGYGNSTTSSTKGLLLSVSVGTLQESYGYDGTNHPSSVTDYIDGKTYATSYQYNTAGQVTQITYPSQRVLSINHDNIGRLSSEGDSGPNGCSDGICGVTYNAAGLTTGLTLANGVTESFGYDPQRLQMTTQTATKGATTLMSLTYGYSAAAGQMGVGTTAGNTGRLVSVTGIINGISETASYSYDVLGRAATSSQTSNGSSAQRRFAYDRWGNRTGVWDSTSGGNQIQAVTLQQSGGAPTNQIKSITGNGAGSYSYDSAGNVTSDGAHTYAYDAENRLVTVDGGSTAQYTYDSKGRRVKKVAGGATTHYVWRGDHVLAEHNGSTGQVLQDYILAGSSFIAKINTNGTFYFVGDRLSERLRLDSNGNVTAQGGHLAFGEDFAETGAVEKHHFTSYERDPETGSDYALNRPYSPVTGRFTTVDRLSASAKLSSPQTLNRYSYTAGDPVNRVDPTGLEDFSSGAGGGGDSPCPDGFFYIGIFLSDAGEETDCGYEPIGGGDSGYPTEPQRSCSFDLNRQEGADPWGRGLYPYGTRNPPVDPLADQIGSYDRGGEFYYFFEVMYSYTLVGSDTDQDWSVHTSATLDYDVFFDTGGGNLSEFKAPTQTVDDDGPFLGNFVLYDLGQFLWLDSPGIPDAVGKYPVINGTGEIHLHYQGLYKGNPECTKDITIFVKIKNKVANWSWIIF